MRGGKGRRESRNKFVRTKGPKRRKKETLIETEKEWKGNIIDSGDSHVSVNRFVFEGLFESHTSNFSETLRRFHSNSVTEKSTIAGRTEGRTDIPSNKMLGRF